MNCPSLFIMNKQAEDPWSMDFVWGTSIRVEDVTYSIFCSLALKLHLKKSANNRIPDPQTPEFLFLIQTSSTTDS